MAKRSQTPKQRAASMRNHAVVRLRGAYYACRNAITIEPECAPVAQTAMIAIDNVIGSMGFEKESARQLKRKLELANKIEESKND